MESQTPDVSDLLVGLTKGQRRLNYHEVRANLVAGKVSADLDADRVAALTFTIERVWPLLAQSKGNFSMVTIPEEREPINEILKALADVFFRAIIDATLAMLRSPADIVHFQHYLMLTQSGQTHDQNATIKHLGINMLGGTLITFSFIELALMKKYDFLKKRMINRLKEGKNPEPIDWEEALKASIDQKHFYRLLTTIGSGSSDAEIALLNHITLATLPTEVNIDRQILDPNSFDLFVGDDGLERLIPKPELPDQVRATHEQRKKERAEVRKKIATALKVPMNEEQATLVKRCPALAVQTSMVPDPATIDTAKNTSVFQEFAKWIVEIAIKNYIPLMARKFAQKFTEEMEQIHP